MFGLRSTVSSELWQLLFEVRLMSLGLTSVDDAPDWFDARFTLDPLPEVLACEAEAAWDLL